MESDESESPYAQEEEEDKTDSMEKETDIDEKKMQKHKVQLLTPGLNFCHMLMTSYKRILMILWKIIFIKIRNGPTTG